jgi:hypothetical protein
MWLLEHVVAHEGNLILPLAFALLGPLGLEIVAPFWATSVAPAHLISFLALKSSMVLCLI